MIEVTRHVHRRYPVEQSGVFAPVINYVDAHRPILYEVAKTIRPERCLLYRSEDNGKTWANVDQWHRREKEMDAQTMLLFSEPHRLFVDPETNVAFRLHDEHAYVKDGCEWAKDTPANRWARPYISYSYDAGLSWSEPRQIMLDGPSYDEVHYLDGVWFGRNAVRLHGPHILKLQDGAVLIIGNRKRIWPSGDIYDSVNHAHTEAFALRGTWDSAGKELQWEMGAAVPIDYNYSQNGLCEMAVAETVDGRLIMVSRIQWPGDESYPMMKVVSQSADGGRTWTTIEPLRYDDGEIVPSVASFPNLVRSIANGKLYYIGNILPRPLYWRKEYSDAEAQEMGLFENPPQGLSDPRTMLQIAELDPDTLRLKRDTVTVIDRREPDEPAYVRLSNWGLYQDRQTKHICLFMTRNAGNVGWKIDDGISRDLYRYDIDVSGV